MVVECVHAKAGEAGDLEREIRLEAIFVVLALPFVHDAGDQIAHRLVTEPGDVDAVQVAIDPNHRRKPGREVKVGRPVLYPECE